MCSMRVKRQKKRLPTLRMWIALIGALALIVIYILFIGF